MPTPLPREVAEELERLKADYDIGEEVRRGANGILFFARNRVMDRAVAIKFYQGEAGERQHLEPQMLASMDSPNVLPILDARSAGDEWAFFVTPRCDGGDLDDLMARGVSARRAVDIALAICAGVSAMHGQRLVHRDLKPANIVLDGVTPRIGDFGSVRLLPDGSDTVHASQHSILYRPPEAFTTDMYGKVGDVYQVGVVTYQLLGGFLPYDDEQYLNRDDRREYERIEDPIDRQLYINSVISRRIQSKTLLKFDTLPPWARPARAPLRRMTATDPTRRLQSIGDAVAALNRIRTAIADWSLTPEGARLVDGERTVELRRRGADRNLYDVFVDSGSGPRRSNAKSGRSLADSVAAFS